MNINTSSYFLKLQSNINNWEAPKLDEDEVYRIVVDCLQREKAEEYFEIIQVEPYIDALYIRLQKDKGKICINRYTFHEDCYWDEGHEAMFHERCVKNSYCGYAGGVMDEIYEIYSARHPEWHLKRYYTKCLRLLDHIYNCLNKNTAKELLYKAGLDELAAHIDEMDEINLLATKPSELYDGLPMKLLRVVNCKEGAVLVSNEQNRRALKEVYTYLPHMFSHRMKDVECCYLNLLFQNGLSIKDIEFSLNARKEDLVGLWTPTQLDAFLRHDREKEKILENITLFRSIDPIYDTYYKKMMKMRVGIRKIIWVASILLGKSQAYDERFQQSNSKRPQEWQESDEHYIVKYPQNIDEYCRETIYMHNCLFLYLEYFLENKTTILFMHRAEDPNTPYIAMEVWRNTLIQAYRKNNALCSWEEKEWIMKYCMRHRIRVNAYGFREHQLSIFDLI